MDSAPLRVVIRVHAYIYIYAYAYCRTFLIPCLVRSEIPWGMVGVAIHRVCVYTGSELLHNTEQLPTTQSMHRRQVHVHIRAALAAIRIPLFELREDVLHDPSLDALCFQGVSTLGE